MASTGSTTAKTTNDLLQEIAVLSDDLDALREGVGATERCQRCWYPASSHASKTSRHCKRREKMSGKSFVDSLLAQRNNLDRVLATVKGEARKEKEIRELQENVDFARKELEAAKSKVRRLVTEREYCIGLLKDLDSTYTAFSEGGTLEEFDHAFHEVVARITEGRVDDSPASSDDEDDAWDHTGDTGDTGDTVSLPQSAVVTSVSLPHSVVVTSGSHVVSTSSSVLPPKKDECHPVISLPVPRTFPAPTTVSPSRPPRIPDFPTLPPRAEYPGFQEKTCPLLHRTDGQMCGGTPDSDKVLRANKILTAKFKASDDALKYLEQRRLFVNEIRCYFSGETLYTLLSIFALKASDHFKVFSPLFDLHCYFTSFLHFLKEFEMRIFPNLQSVALATLHTRTQKEKESVNAYYNEFVDLVTILDRDPNDYLNEFLAGLRNQHIATTAGEHYYPPGERSLLKVMEHASHIEQELQLRAVYKNKQSLQSRAVVASASQQSMQVSRVAPFQSHMQQHSMQVSRVAPFQSNAQRGRGSNFRPNVGWRGPNNQMPNNQMPSVNAVSSLQPEYKRLEQKMRSLRLDGCAGCLGKGHRWNMDYSNCRLNCPFCMVPLRDRNARHPAIDCPFLPVRRHEIIAIASAADKNGASRPTAPRQA